MIGQVSLKFPSKPSVPVEKFPDIFDAFGVQYETPYYNEWNREVILPYSNEHEAIIAIEIGSRLRWLWVAVGYLDGSEIVYAGDQHWWEANMMWTYRDWTLPSAALSVATAISKRITREVMGPSVDDLCEALEGMSP